MLYFKTRTLARSFKAKNPAYKVVDSQDNLSANGLRWAVKVV